ncbi:Gfo/Idh/MocA family oxidoreductase [Cellulophaga baltica]|uniref:Gfo/Idh/MocA family protein n=1 Tax=Cellulophaga TaxID=104264 RepID=UPI001C06FF91|nr:MULTISPECIES: Gfo/Idh/MocA family oxidoreductase [Cellulophaga]MBU2995585.1 Gfo/Idh/MocA family oxidoreductase [Cellulophaga baltica]MDO6766979.1 Gfo/Idh/MocA family oxidoreductase [Cellulophaga sp. 1_MG-2023]
MNKPVRWGIIGCGSVTEVKSGPPYKNTTGFSLDAVMRRDKAKVEDYAKRHGVPKAYTDASDLINDPDIDAIYIATPPDTHKLYGLEVANADKPCCIEKPLAPNYEDSLAIVEAFKAKNIPLFVAYYRRSLPRFLQVENWLRTKKIGEVRSICWNLFKPANDIDLSGEYNWRTDKKIAPGGYFDDLACHGLDLFAYLLGAIKTAHGVSTNQQGLYTGKDAITASWMHENGVTGLANWNFGSYKREDKVEIIGTKGRIQFSVFSEEDIVLENESGIQKLFIENPKHVQQYHVENLKADLVDGKKHSSTGETALEANWVMSQILK